MRKYVIIAATAVIVFSLLPVLSLAQRAGGKGDQTRQRKRDGTGQVDVKQTAPAANPVQQQQRLRKRDGSCGQCPLGAAAAYPEDESGSTVVCPNDCPGCPAMGGGCGNGPGGGRGAGRGMGAGQGGGCGQGAGWGGGMGGGMGRGWRGGRGM